jgi:hypothetical protein
MKLLTGLIVVGLMAASLLLPAPVIGVGRLSLETDEIE